MTEIDAMGTINDALEPLDEDERIRVLEWAVSKFVAARFNRLRSLQEEVKAAESDALKGITKVMEALTEAAARLNMPPVQLAAVIDRLATEVKSDDEKEGP